MSLFSRGKAEPEPGLVAQVFELRTIVESLRSEVRTLSNELALQSDLVTKRMRRAVAAERAIDRHQERTGSAEVQGAPLPDSAVSASAMSATPGRSPNLWGARGRIARRRAQLDREAAASTNGTGGLEPAEAED